MKLATLSTTGGTRVVAVDPSAGDYRYVDLAAVDASLPASLRELLAAEGGVERAAAAAEKGLAAGQFVEGTIQAPIPDPGKVICIGLNYRDHAEESGMAIPEEPVCFSKFGNTIIGPGESIRLPAVSQQVDYEAELVVVIGKRAYGVAREDAFDYVAGYMNGHDVSARDWQIGKPGKQWLLGKTPDTFAPIGPWLVTRDEVADPHAMDISLRLNGETMQSGNTREFIFGVDELIAYLTQIMTLEPGDIIFTGTPPGVGMARDPQVFLKPGDQVEVEIAGLGVLGNPVVGG
ncbi:fumarylacetoacetate hydrolase family protein [Maioricimonas sp. JC845]|uniref:fumarylacetoacetate hydrolase family protein n=1 Tax=Maioricimonas sp. JC845 TaxID=3232138 RepID=UPI00345AF63E